MASCKKPVMYGIENKKLGVYNTNGANNSETLQESATAENGSVFGFLVKAFDFVYRIGLRRMNSVAFAP